jgi:hypothetical protein
VYNLPVTVLGHSPFPSLYVFHFSTMAACLERRSSFTLATCLNVESWFLERTLSASTFVSAALI